MKKLIALSLLLSASAARADSPTADEDRFFIDKVDDERTAETTLWQGSFTSTTFLHRENAGIAAPLTGAGVGTENAASFVRLFTDLRAQVDARHISGGNWDLHLDGRVRYAPDVTPTDKWKTFAPQSGTLGNNEYELRELYVTHGGARTDVYLGRQIVLDLAATKIDGIRLDYASSETWTYLGFAGLYPTRGSRSIDSDYPKAIDAMGNTSGRVLPVAGGIGAAYRTSKSYGALGMAGIAPLSRDRVTGGQEQPRVFVTSNGYWRPSIGIDLFHYVVVDLLGTGGAGLTNLSLGANWKPVPRLHLTALVNSVDTETLNVQAQAQLSDPSQQLPGVVNNEIAVSRISSRSARLGLSVGLGQAERFEVSTAAQLRARPDINVATGMGSPPVTIKAAQAAELSLSAVDRHSIAGLRLGVLALRAFGVGDASLTRTSTLIVRASAQREIGDGKGEWEVDLGYAASKDDNTGVTCVSSTLSSCWGSSEATTLSLDGLGLYRLGRDWMAVASLELASQHLKTSDTMTIVDQPSILMITAMARLSYRF